MKASIAIVMVICGVFLLLSPQLLPVIASAADVTLPARDGMSGTVVPLVGVLMIVLGVVMPWIHHGKSGPTGG